MVYPSDRVFNNGGAEVKVPRARKYVAGTLPPYAVIIQSRSNNPLPFVKLGKALYDQYATIETYFISRKKIKIITTDMSVANAIAADEKLNTDYSTFIPSELCEVKGVCPIPAEYQENEVFDHAFPKNMQIFGNVSDNCVISEVKRFSRNDPAKPGVRYNIDSILICFTGNVLPSHVSLDSVNYPVNPYREKILQCRKCWHFGHTERVCSRVQKLCNICGAVHNDESECINEPKCINCKGNHSASSFLCPTFKKIKQTKNEKANSLKPKPISFTLPGTSYAQATVTNNLNEFPSLYMPLQERVLPSFTAPISQKEPVVVPSKRFREEDEVNVVSGDAVKNVEVGEVFEDLKAVLSSQINEINAPVVIPFFKSIMNLLSGENTIKSNTKNGFKSVFSDVLNNFNDDDDEDITV